MASLTDVVSMALTAVAKIARKLQGFCGDALKRCKVADEESAEQGLNMGDMESSGVRNRRGTEQTSGSADNHADSPTTSATSGTLMPRTGDGPLERKGMDAVPWGACYYVSQHKQYLLEDSFIKGTWQRLSDRLGTGLLSGMSAEERKRLNQERGYHKFKQVKCELVP
jgi:hypothetical protein